MLATLESIARAEGLPFRYGSTSSENIAADDQIDGEWLYQEGYLNGQLRLDSDNAVSVTYTVNLWLMNPSALDALPAQRGPQLIAILLRLIRIYRRIAEHGTVGTANFIEGINLLDRNVDGIRMTFTFTPTLPMAVC